jgi:hypothetical protein
MCGAQGDALVCGDFWGPPQCDTMTAPPSAGPGSRDHEERTRNPVTVSSDPKEHLRFPIIRNQIPVPG